MAVAFGRSLGVGRFVALAIQGLLGDLDRASASGEGSTELVERLLGQGDGFLRASGLTGQGVCRTDR